MRRGDPRQLAGTNQGPKRSRIHRIRQTHDRPERDIAIAFEQGIIALKPSVDRGTRSFANGQFANVGSARKIDTIGRGAAANFDLGRIEATAEH
ncbi:MAG: hypothetical protein Q8K85_08965, partial [Hyphomicrobium sp.]|nr:hypothetical protein [Hyphomicrobium sp.]